MTKNYFNISIYDDVSDELPRKYSGLTKDQVSACIENFFQHDMQEGMSFHVFVYDVDADDFDDFDEIWQDGPFDGTWRSEE